MPGLPHPINSSAPSAEKTDESALVTALRCGNEAAFAMLVDRFHASLVRLAIAYVADRSVAEEIAQETWLALVRGIDRFEGRSTLKTWLFHVVSYQARLRMTREGRTVPFSVLDDQTTVSPDRFEPAGAEWEGHWSQALMSWDDTPEERLLAEETRSRIAALIATLPSRQQAVIMLRDIEGLSAPDVCQALEISDQAQRLLLHRARARVRQGMEHYLAGE